MNTIKKYVIGLAFGMAMASTIISCDTLDEKFTNPEITEADFSLLFASAQTKDIYSGMTMEQLILYAWFRKNARLGS